MVAEDNPYGPESIEVLTGLQPVRKRPGMYVGDTTDGSGLHHLLWEVVGNAIDEHLAGHATRIDVTVDGATATVEDDGRGIPVERHPSGTSALELVLTMLHAGPTRDGHTPHVHIGWRVHGVGLAAVNALCDHLRAIVVRGGRRYEIAFARGELCSPLEDCGPTSTRGTRIELCPDPTIFAHPRFDVRAIARHLRELSYFDPGLCITFNGEVFEHPRGLETMVTRLARVELGSEGSGEEVGPVVHVQGEADDVRVDVAMTWSGNAEPRVSSYVNHRSTEQGGTHVEGLRRGLAAALNAWWPHGVEQRRPDLDRMPGFLAVVHVGLYEPRFGGPTRALLASADARAGVEAVVARALPAWLDAHPDEARTMRDRWEGSA